MWVGIILNDSWYKDLPFAKVLTPNQITKEDTKLWITDNLTSNLHAEFWKYFTCGLVG